MAQMFSSSVHRGLHGGQVELIQHATHKFDFSSVRTGYTGAPYKRYAYVGGGEMQSMNGELHGLCVITPAA